MSEEERATILELAETVSYGLIGQRYGLTRNQVAGIVWRAKNPKQRTVDRPKGGPNEYPRFTLWNSQW